MRFVMFTRSVIRSCSCRASISDMSVTEELLASREISAAVGNALLGLINPELI